MEAVPRAPEVSARDMRAESLPEIAVFGAWRAESLGEQAIHAAACRFFEECGWLPRSFNLRSLALGGEQDGARPPAKRFARQVWQRVRLLRLLTRLEPVQAIAVGGGGLLSDDSSHFPQSLVELGRVCPCRPQATAVSGLQRGGTWSASGWRMIREFLEACTVLAVRDSDTAARLGNTLGSTPPIFGDFCLSGGLPERVGDRRTLRYQLAINASQLPAPWVANQERLEDALVSIARSAAARMAARAVDLSIFTTGGAEDARVAKRVQARLEPRGSRLCLPSSLEDLAVLLRTSLVVVATHLHGAILPLADGVPVVGLDVASRLRGFFSTMNMDRYCYEIGSSAQLADWLALVDLGIVMNDQERALTHASVWRARPLVRARVASLATARHLR